MNAIPDHVSPYRRTPEFNQDSLPDVWRGPHSTKKQVWGRIVVLEGRLLLVLMNPEEQLYLDPDHNGVVAPRMSHLVKPLGPVRFYVEFYR